MNSVGIKRFCFCGFMAAMLAAAVTAVSSEAGADWKDAAMLANAAAGVVVGKMGTATVTPAELLALYREQEAR